MRKIVVCLECLREMEHAGKGLCSRCFWRTKENLASKIYAKQRASSRRRNHPYPNYNLKEFKIWFYSQPNLNMLYSNYKDSVFDKNLVPSVDRKEDSKPYSLDNIQLTTWEENNKAGAYRNQWTKD